MKYAREMLCYPWSSLIFINELKNLGFRGTGYEDCKGMIQVCSPSILQANSMKYAREMLCYLLKFPKFEVVN